METAHYDTDFYGWALEQSALLKAGKVSGLDFDNLADEIESLGKSDKRTLESETRRLLAHLLKWQYQPQRRGASWRKSIEDAREKIQFALDDSKTLRNQWPELIGKNYVRAAAQAKRATGLDCFPKNCPYSWEQLLDDEFYPTH